MNNEIIINGQKAIKIVTVINYVNITFGDYNTKQIPGTTLEKPSIDIQLIESNKTYNYYKVLYSWKYLGLDAPLIVPNNDTVYEPNFINIEATKETINIMWDKYEQNQNNSFYITSIYPLYFKGETMDGIIKKDVRIERVTIIENNKYKMTLNFHVNGITNLVSSKEFNVMLSIYKDYSCTKYLGYINVKIKMYVTSGPGE